jgi:hypothetical protein
MRMWMCHNRWNKDLEDFKVLSDTQRGLAYQTMCSRKGDEGRVSTVANPVMLMQVQFLRNLGIGR